MRRSPSVVLAWACMAGAMLVVVVGCSGAATTATSVTVRSTSARVGGRRPAVSSTSTSRRCSATRVRSLVERFIHAFNAGNQQMLQRQWSRADFSWYSTQGPGRRVAAASRSRASLGQYFAARHAAGESLRLTSFRFNGVSPDGAGNFQFTLVRAADHLRPTAYEGKGGALCNPPRPTLFVWSMGPDHRGGPSHTSAHASE